MFDADHVRVLADVLGVSIDDSDADAAAFDVPGDYGALPAVDAEADRTPTDVTVDPGLAADEFNAFVSTFSLADSDAAAGGHALSGLDVAVKDNVAVAGVPLTAGADAFADATPVRHAPVVSRLLDAGATLTGEDEHGRTRVRPHGRDGRVRADAKPQAGRPRRGRVLGWEWRRRRRGSRGRGAGHRHGRERPHSGLLLRGRRIQALVRSGAAGGRRPAGAVAGPGRRPRDVSHGRRPSWRRNRRPAQ
nr:amidase family protein [Halobacterium bonnevillei]